MDSETARTIGVLVEQLETALRSTAWEDVATLSNRILALDSNNKEGRAALKLASMRLTDKGGTGSMLPGEVLPRGFVNDRYVGSELLVAGERRRVYRAHDTLLDRHVVFTVLEPERDGADQGLELARLGGRLGAHPNIVTLFDFGIDGDTPYTVGEYLAGGSVATLRTSRQVPLPVARSVEIAVGVSQALDHAHQMGVVHGRLTPSAVWLAEDGTPKVEGFGQGSLVRQAHEIEQLAATALATDLAPELIGGGQATASTDVYALGAMLYELVAARPPFETRDNGSILSQVLNAMPVAPARLNRSCPRSLDALIMRMLAKSESQRPSAQEVTSALKAVDLGDLSQREQHLASLATGVFVGRRRELDRMRAALEQCRAGHGRTIMLVGEAGIGKTRIAEELSTHATLRNTTVVWGRCYEDEGAPSYWPWVQALRAVVRGGSAEQLRQQLGSDASIVAHLIPDVRELLPDVTAEVAGDDLGAARFRLFDAVLGFLSRVTELHPVIIILDDLHWADAASLKLLEFVTREIAHLPILIVGSYRDSELSGRHPLTRTLGDLARERVFERIVLRGLDDANVDQFIAVATGARPASDLVRAVHVHTDGNPLFVTEVVRLLVQEGRLDASTTPSAALDTVRIPEGLRGAIGRRLDKLSPRCADALTAAAILGRDFGLAKLLATMDVTGERELLQLIEEALQSRLLDEQPGSPGEYRFSHALIQRTILDELSSARRARMHARVAAILESYYGADRADHAPELAYHFREAETVLGSAKLSHYARLAGNRALEQHAYEEALTYFEQALASYENQPLDDDAAGMLFATAKAQLATLEVQLYAVAIPNLTRAFEYYAERGDIEQAVKVAEYHIPSRGYQQTAASVLIPRALKLVEKDSLLAGRVLARYGVLLGLVEGEYDEARNAFAEALAIAEREGDAGLQLYCYSTGAIVDGYHLSFERAVASGNEAIEFSRIAREPFVASIAHFWCGLAFLFQGSASQAEFHLGESLREIRIVRHRYRTAITLIVQHFLHRVRGDVEQSRETIGAALALAPREVVVRSMAAIGAYEAADAVGEIHLGYVRDAVRRTPPGPTLEYSMATLALGTIAYVAEQGALAAEARTIASDVLSSASATPLMLLWTRTGLALGAVQQDDAVAARELYERLSELSADRLPAWSYVSMDRLQGLLCATAGDFEQASVHFDDALKFTELADYRRDGAWTAFEYGAMLCSRAGDHLKRGHALVAQARALAEVLQMTALLRKITAYEERLTHRETANYPDGLSQREVEVLGQIARGLTNQEAADVLQISPKTVSSHLVRIFEKIGVGNRTEAAAYANARGLTDSAPPAMELGVKSDR